MSFFNPGKFVYTNTIQTCFNTVNSVQGSGRKGPRKWQRPW